MIEVESACCLRGGYQQVREWVKAMLENPHATVAQTMAWATLCLVVAQGVTGAFPTKNLPFFRQSLSTRISSARVLCYYGSYA